MRAPTSAATWSARRVLPTPPGPVRVTRGTSSRSSKWQTTSTSCLRPMSGLRDSGSGMMVSAARPLWPCEEASWVKERVIDDPSRMADPLASEAHVRSLMATNECAGKSLVARLDARPDLRNTVRKGYVTMSMTRYLARGDIRSTADGVANGFCGRTPPLTPKCASRRANTLKRDGEWEHVQIGGVRSAENWVLGGGVRRWQRW